MLPLNYIMDHPILIVLSRMEETIPQGRVEREQLIVSYVKTITGTKLGGG